MIQNRKLEKNTIFIFKSATVLIENKIMIEEKKLSTKVEKHNEQKRLLLYNTATANKTLSGGHYLDNF